MPTPVTKSSQMEESGSSRDPASALNEERVTSRLTKFRCPSPLPDHVYTIVSNGRPVPCAKCVYSMTVKQANRKARTTTPTETASTVAFCSRRPKKNIITAPKAGRSGISQMWSRNSIQHSAVNIQPRTFHFREQPTSTPNETCPNANQNTSDFLSQLRPC